MSVANKITKPILCLICPEVRHVLLEKGEITAGCQEFKSPEDFKGNSVICDFDMSIEHAVGAASLTIYKFKHPAGKKHDTLTFEELILCEMSVKTYRITEVIPEELVYVNCVGTAILIKRELMRRVLELRSLSIDELPVCFARLRQLHNIGLPMAQKLDALFTTMGRPAD